jgi:hypothetical protein
MNVAAASVLLSAALLTGCTTQLDYMAYRSSQVGDEALSVNEYGVCKLTSVRAVMERYGTSAERLQAWQDFCWPELQRLFP